MSKVKTETTEKPAELSGEAKVAAELALATAKAEADAAKKAAAAELAAVKKAEAAAEREKKAAAAKAEREKAAAEKAAEKDKKTAEANRLLDPMAKEINARLQKAADIDVKGDDHRLAAALVLEKAREVAEAMGLSFKVWCETKITVKGASGKVIGYETIRKLATVGASENPALALADMREGNKAANKKSRDAKKLVKAAAAGSKGGKSNTAIADANTITDETLLVKDAIASLGEKGMNAVRDVASESGFELVPKAEAKALREGTSSAGPVGLDALKLAFQAMKAKDRMDFVKWAAEQVGFTVNVPDLGAEPELPNELKR